MKNEQLMFHATKGDIIPILSHLENTFDIRYAKIGMFGEKKVIYYNTYSDIEELGYTESSFYLSSPNSYMIIEKNMEVIIRDIPQRKGGILYAVDQKENPKSIELTLGGIYTEGENTLVMSRAACISEFTFSKSIYKELTKNIKKAFKKYDFMEWVGPEAEQKLKEGWRLVQDAKRSTDYDLKYKEV
ncbi:hypothetical protein [Chryseobacterium viscerum]|uniref:Uncharacterized protein n=1 Tax=Chryseobacterium viscerum TaxID=1037377 RepID=A0A316WRW5_9FLAO|nr:hypothetical protein [Chryseobacterium viscerum]PWN64151.1 hypothetical protein C1634_006035 [Chryseobacterium viscerum]